MKLKYTLKYLESLPTLQSGHFDNLKIETQTKRVWLSRMTVEDGMPYNNQVLVEELKNGRWAKVKSYKAE